MKVLILVALVTVCIVGLTKAGIPFGWRPGDVDRRALLQEFLSSLKKDATAKQENAQWENEEEDAEEEKCPPVCGKKQKEQQKKALQALISSMMKDATAKQENAQWQNEEEDANEEMCPPVCGKK